MKLKFLIAFCFMVTTVVAQDIIVKKDGTILQVYYLEESANTYFYSLDNKSGSATFRISKEDVFTVKKNGASVTSQVESENVVQQQMTKREAVIATFLSEIINKKKDGRCFSARTPDGHELNYQVLSEKDYTVVVVKGKYKETEYVIPEYVQEGDTRYVVTEIAEEAFYDNWNITNIQFPYTLKKIGIKAFTGCGIESIVLPEGLEIIERAAFASAGQGSFFRSRKIKEIYLPMSVKSIGENAFRNCGKDRSPNLYCQAYFSCMPDFITEGNCDSYGIDDAAVKAYYARKK